MARRYRGRWKKVGGTEREEGTEHDKPRRADDLRLGERKERRKVVGQKGKGRERKGVCSEGGERMGRIDLSREQRRMLCI